MRSFIDAHRKRGKEITGDAYAVLVTNPGYEILRWASSTGIGRRPRTPSMNSRTRGAGAATPHTTCIVVSWLLVPWH